MDSSAQPDILSNLPDVLLVLIISSLPFKECITTSVLSKRWRYLCRQTTNVSFKESDFVKPSVNAISRIYARHAFLGYVFRWVTRIHDQVIESFEISLSHPMVYLVEIEALIAFAVRKQVKKLVLDFSRPNWRTFRDVPYYELIVEVPESVYNLTSLESLTVKACKKFDPLRFANLGIFKSLSFGWMRLTNLESLLSKSSRLESLSINDCWGLDVMEIAGDMREIAFKNCDSPFIACSFNLPKVDIFKYSGNVFCFHFERMNTIIKEVHLDFGILGEYDELDDQTNTQGQMICGLLNKLRSARTLTVCPYLLQAIKEGSIKDSNYPMHLLRPVKTQHLVLKTKLEPKEFNGIRLLLKNCPDLESLTFDMLPSSSIATASSYADIDPRTYWMENITYNCLRKTLKTVVVRNFLCGPNELNVLKYLIRSGSGCGSGSGPVLQKIELYLPNGLDESQIMYAYEGAEMLQRRSKHVQVSCAQFLKR